MFMFELDVINSPVPVLRTVVAERTCVHIAVLIALFWIPSVVCLYLIRLYETLLLSDFYC